MPRVRHDSTHLSAASVPNRIPYSSFQTLPSTRNLFPSLSPLIDSIFAKEILIIRDTILYVHFFLIELKEKKKVISFSEIQSGERELMHEREREREKKKTRGLLQRNHFPRDELWRQPEHVQLPAMHDMKIVASRRNITGITGRQRNIGFSAVSFPFRIHNPSIIGTRVNLQEVTRRKHATRNIAGCIVSLISLYYTIIEKKVAITGNTRVTRVSLTPSSRR